ALDPNKSLGPPPSQEAVPYFNFAPLNNALQRLQESAAAYDRAVAGDVASSAETNRLLFTSERLLSLEQGLEGRTWYKHHIYAPGFYTGYGVKTIPGVREAIEQRDYSKVDPQIQVAARVLNQMSERIEHLTALTTREPQ
ncbi:MAG TPA: transferrin receptor-like dimerization domain-containing protein, partial [Xanthomonadales bacterium]|nr:transferrin receptor-like dimerization domain-containing protein [Xanthomonadales bacterium]